MGSQVTFALDSPGAAAVNADQDSKQHLKAVSMPEWGIDVKLYARSMLGFGRDAVLTGLKTFKGQAQPDPTADPCKPKGWLGPGNAANVKTKGLSDPSACRKDIQAYVKQESMSAVAISDRTSLFKVPVPASTKFYAFEVFWYASALLGNPAQAPFSTIPPLADKFCRLTHLEATAAYEKVRAAQPPPLYTPRSFDEYLSLCMSATYADVFLQNGLGLDRTGQLVLCFMKHTCAYTVHKKLHRKSPDRLCNI